MTEAPRGALAHWIRIKNSAPPAPATYERVYVWEPLVRFYHWLNALCVGTLIVTGYLIGTPWSHILVSSITEPTPKVSHCEPHLGKRIAEAIRSK